MRILLVASWYHNYKEQSSAGIFHYEQAACLDKYCDVAIYYPFDLLLDKPVLKESENGITIYRSRWGSSPLKNRKDIYSGFSEVIKDFKPDIIHAQVASQAGVYSVIEGAIHRIPVIITEHNPIELMSLENRKSYLRNKFAYSSSRANICVSNDSRDRLSAYFPKESFRVIYNGIIDPNNIEDDGGSYRREGTVNACIVAGFYSKDIKGYQFLLPAIKKLTDKGLAITLHIVGGGEYEQYYKDMAKSLGIEDRCVFYGLCNREKVYSIVRQVDFNISASIFECSGVSVQEAMLLGKPLVVTRSGGANSLVTDKTAIVVDRNSIDELAAGIENMAYNYKDFDEKEIHEYAYSNFEIENVNRKYLKLYEEILNKK